ncbi:glutamate ABC transporter substrate-binding protein [Streptomyces sp. PSKA54]|uniref:Glutamate ABC transporter substrate-binding protein n=1 Tax=Streptomyces himalayensis subsp. aureolus TaxID=2758039 RepID=A0A7W2CZ61_9ACTN|nr:glutamate ABC transporter substrate-binding protein [Streptomyces himalayensis]MBA4861753.1 glutamate ABC transporter substrate-binding protein [Streptomyces himalayensis subsp. aureolus]
MLRGRLRSSLRGWGGVAAMAVACALTAVFALLLPLTQARGDSSTGQGGQGVAEGAQVKADDCNPEASLRPSPKDGPFVEDIKKRGYLTVGVDQNSYRWGYRDPNKSESKLEGFDIDLVHAIAEEILGPEPDIRFRAVPTNQRIPAIKNGDVDMVVRTMTITCERLDDVAFSTAYFKTGQQVLAPKNSDITGYNKTLKDKKVCSAKSSTAEDELEKNSFGADTSTKVPNQLDCLVRLQLGEVDAVVTDGALAASQAAQDPTVMLMGEPFTEEYYGVAMKREAEDLVRRVNQVLVDYRKGDWQASYEEWLADVPGMADTAEPPAPEYSD